MKSLTYRRKVSIIAGVGYLIIFFGAIFANFFVLEKIIQDPLQVVQENELMVRMGIIAFLVVTVFDIVVAWALFELFRDHKLSNLSMIFRLVHAVIMGLAVYNLVEILSQNTSVGILNQVDSFNVKWLIGLLFFGFHLILLGKIIPRPKVIAILLMLAGVMYIVDTVAHFLVPNYQSYSTIFLMLVAIPSIISEMSLTIWLLIKGGKQA